MPWFSLTVSTAPSRVWEGSPSFHQDTEDTAQPMPEEPSAHTWLRASVHSKFSGRRLLDSRSWDV